MMAVMNEVDDDEGSVPGLLTAVRLETRDRRWAVWGGKRVYLSISQHWFPCTPAASGVPAMCRQHKAGSLHVVKYKASTLH